MDIKNWVEWFRHASPYINAHRNKTLVLAFSGAALQTQNFENIVHDLALLNSLGVRLVLVYGARPQIDAALSLRGLSSEMHNGLRVTEQSALPSVLEAYGRLRAELEARFSMGVINSPMHGASINVVSGNFVMAKPVGVLDGIDFACTGVVRTIDGGAINKHLQNNDIVLIPAVGYSVTGEVFNLAYEALAGDVAAQLLAEKIVFFGQANGLQTDSGSAVKQLSVEHALIALNEHEPPLSSESQQQLKAAADCCKAGVRRAHLLSYSLDGALLEELFTRDGSGTMISQDDYDEIRSATLTDINGIQELIQPLEDDGLLVRRSRERLETELGFFLVNVRDNAIIGCAALYPFPADDAGELSCFAIAEHYRREGRGDKILDAILTRAKEQNLAKLFVLTTQTEHWFRERGFESSSANELPGAKHYNSQRNAKVLFKRLSGIR